MRRRTAPEVKKAVADVAVELLGGWDLVVYNRAYTKTCVKNGDRIEVHNPEIEQAVHRVYKHFFEHGLVNGMYSEYESIVKDARRRLPRKVSIKEAEAALSR